MRGNSRRRADGAWWAGPVLAAIALATVLPGATAGAASGSAARPAGAGTVWLCRPGLADDPCTASLDATVVSASGARTHLDLNPATSSRFDCFYVYPTVSDEVTENADLRVQRTEIAAAVAQASRFSRVCRVYAPIYRQVTLFGLASALRLSVSASATAIAYDSIRAGLESYLTEYNDNRPIIFIGHSQGAAMLILLLRNLVDDDPSLRARMAMAIILGGNVEVPTGKDVGGTFAHLPLCTDAGETGCILAYSSFPSTPPTDSLFGRPGQGVSLQSGQRATTGLSVACTNPAALAGGSGSLDPFFPSLGVVATPWVSYPGLYTARCVHADGATYLQVTKATGASDTRPVVTESDGPEWGYHADDVNLALGNLVADVAAAEAHWSSSPH